MREEDRPEVQRNGFKLIAHEWDVPDETLDEFFQDWFDPSQTWDENLDTWFTFFNQLEDAVTRVEREAESVEDVEELIE